ncbi:MAG: hypothetical protein AB7O55_35895, partial [Lautropia sp.]
LAAYIHQGGWRDGWRVFTAAAVSLAVKGLVAFEGDPKRPTLVRTPKPEPVRAPGGAPAAGGGTTVHPEPPLPAGERALLSWLERNGGGVRIDRSNGEGVADALASFKAAIERENRDRFFRRNLGHVAAGVVLTVAAIAMMLQFGGLSERELGFLIGTCVVCAVVGAFLVRIVRGLLSGRRLRTIVIFAIHLAVLGWLIFMGVSLGLFGQDGVLSALFGRTLTDALRENGFSFALVGGFALLNGLFYYLLRAPTAAGRVMMDRIEGLLLYLRTAESARLNLAGAPELTAERFERLLPYAIALGVEKPWSEAFEAAFERAHPGQDARGAYRPTWHSGSDWEGRSFSSSVSGAVAAVQGSFASAVPPSQSSSSGFSSDGGSGGGGGGGGGGGW